MHLYVVFPRISAGVQSASVPIRWEIQFKGAGLTPFSRTADGRKVSEWGKIPLGTAALSFSVLQSSS